MTYEFRFKPGDKIGGQYFVYESHVGGFGEVYLCLDVENNYPYALKTLKQTFLWDRKLRSLFANEVETWISLEKHPNIVRCYFMKDVEAIPFMFLEWVQGDEYHRTSLRDWLVEGALSPRRAFDFALDICQGLQHAYQKRHSFVHRDLKPENILISQGIQAKITDFGLAKVLINYDEGTTGINYKNQNDIGNDSFGIIGTPAYMCPEQWCNGRIDFRSDIYALGIIFYEMLTGFRPYQSHKLSDLKSQHLSAKIPLLPYQLKLPRSVNCTIEKCLAKDPENRFPSIESLQKNILEQYEELFSEKPHISHEIDGFNAVDFLNRGMTYYSIGKYKQALNDVMKGIELDCGHEEAYINLGLIHHRLGDNDKALQALNQVIQSERFSAHALSALGMIYSDVGNYQAAFDSFHRSIQINPNIAKTYFNLGNNYADIGDYEDALIAFNKAIELDPKVSDFYTNRGNSFKLLDQKKEALEDYNQAIRLAPLDPDPYLGRASIYAEFGRSEQAFSDYQYAIDIRPDDPKIYVSRSVLFSTVGKNDKALADLHHAIELDPNFSPAFTKLGILYILNGQVGKGFDYLGEAIKLGDKEAENLADEIRQSVDNEKDEFPLDILESLAVLRAFLYTNSLEDMMRLVTRFPVVLQPEFFSQLLQMKKEIPSQQLRGYELRLKWLYFIKHYM